MKNLVLFLTLLLAPLGAAAQTATTYYTVPTIAALKALTTSRPPVVQVVDANPGIFNLSSGACSAADDIYQVQPTSGTTVCYTRMSSAYALKKAVTLGGSLTTSGAYASTFTMTGATGVTFPTSGTLATTTTPAASVVVGTTAVAGGATSRLFYDNAGVLGQTSGLTWNGSVFGLTGLLGSTSVSTAGGNASSLSAAMTGSGTTDSTNLLVSTGYSGTGSAAQARNLHAIIDLTHTSGTVTFAQAITGYVRLGLAGSAVSNVTAARFLSGHIAHEGTGGTIATAAVLEAGGIDLLDGSGTIGETYGVMVGDQGHATRVTSSAYGVSVTDMTVGAPITAAYHSAMSSGTGKYSMYFAGTAKGYHGGQFSIGTTSMGTEQVRISQSSSGATTYGLLISNPNSAASTAAALSLDPTGNGVNSRDGIIKATTNGGGVITMAFLLANGGTPANVLSLNPITSTLTGIWNVTGASSAAGATSTLTATAIPAGGTAGSGYLFSSTANFGVFFGSGAPTLSVAQGSLYLRSNGAPAYNNNGTTGYYTLASLENAQTFSGVITHSANLVVGSGNRAKTDAASAGTFSGTTYRMDDNANIVAINYSNFGLNAAAQGISNIYTFGTGGVSGASAGQVSMLATDTWAAAGNRSAKLSVSVATAGSLNTVMEASSTAFNIFSGAVYQVGGVSGLSVTKTVRASGGLSDCNLVFTGGILTSSTC